jgi:hypothetical protein
MDPNVHYRVHRCPPLAHILSQISPVHTIPYHHISKIHFNIFDIRFGFPSRLIPSGFSTNTLYTFISPPFPSPHSREMPMPWPSHPTWSFSQRVQDMKFLMQFKPASCHFIFHCSKYSLVVFKYFSSATISDDLFATLMSILTCILVFSVRPFLDRPPYLYRLKLLCFVFIVSILSPSRFTSSA